MSIYTHARLHSKSKSNSFVKKNNRHTKCKKQKLQLLIPFTSVLYNAIIEKKKKKKRLTALTGFILSWCLILLFNILSACLYCQVLHVGASNKVDVCHVFGELNVCHFPPLNSEELGDTVVVCSLFSLLWGLFAESS